MALTKTPKPASACLKWSFRTTFGVQLCVELRGAAWLFAEYRAAYGHVLRPKYLKERGVTVKALLLLDNAPSHPDVSTLISKDGNIKAMYLPPNTTALFQPMDQGVIEAMKKRYRKAMLQKLLLEDEEGRSIIEFVKQINMKDVVYMTAVAWEDIPPLTLTKSWNKLLRTWSTVKQSTSTSERSASADKPTAQQLTSIYS